MINKGTRDKAGRADRENERLAINTASRLVTGISKRPLAFRGKCFAAWFEELQNPGTGELVLSCKRNQGTAVGKGSPGMRDVR